MTMLTPSIQPKVDSSSFGKGIRDFYPKIKAMSSKNMKEDREAAFSKAEEEGRNSIIRPFTRQNIFYYYAPALGTVSYTVLSINVLNPSLRFSFLPKRDMTNMLLVTALFGSGCYLYSRSHLKNAKSSKVRYGYSVLGSIMFNFSSVLIWAILRSVLPENVALCSAAGLASSYVLVEGAKNYLKFVDKTSM